MECLILPTQLFDPKYYDRDERYILYEHPWYFKRYQYNKKKLMLHRASMKSYYDLMKRRGFSIRYLEFSKKPPKSAIPFFDPIDRVYFEYYEESPNFLIEDYSPYREKSDKFVFAAFYRWGREQIDLIPKMKSQDRQNRKPLPKKLTVPKPPSPSKSKYIVEATRYVNRHFPKNYGTTDGFNFPIDHSSARRGLTKFLKERFKNFGAYQDAIDPENSHLFHSWLSSSINIGLLNPSEVVEAVKKYRSKVPLNSYEGFIRQLFWREYQRFCYDYSSFTNNFFGHRKKLSRSWYSGDLGIDPVDHCIEKAFETAYLNHIERLMVVGNFMNLSGIAPKEGFRWFMEFSIDSYEWVMHQNVYDMVFFGQKTMRKPYASSSNYILKMSRYSKGEWSEEWDRVYRKFVEKHRKKLWPYRWSFPTLTRKN